MAASGSTQVEVSEAGRGAPTPSSAPQALDVLPVVRLEPRGSRGAALQLREVWSYRYLLYFLIWRDIKVRYKQTLLGGLWAILQPVMAMIVFSIFFGKLAKMPSDGVPYPLFAYTALLPWQLFANGLTLAANSLVSNESLVKKVYFPRILIPIACVLEGVVDFALALVVLFAMALYYGHPITLRVFALPAFVLLSLGAATAIGVWLAALNAKYRDIRYTLTFLTQIWMFATPIAYPMSLVPERFRLLYALNPMVGVIEGFRWAMVGSNSNFGAALAVSAVVTLLTLMSGLAYFRRAEVLLADVL